MNIPGDKGKKDDVFEDELNDIGRQYDRLEKIEPPELLDMAVLNSARRAVARKQGQMKLGWMHAVATVAVFGITFSLVLKQTSSDIDGTLAPREEQEMSLSQEPEMTEMPRVRTTSKVENLTIKAFEAAPSAPATRESRESSAGAELDKETSRSGSLSEFQAMKASTGKGAADARQAADEPLEATMMADAVAPVEMERQDADAGAAEQLARILQLKEAGDETWKKELENFIRTYPDYELPEALKTPGQ
jgi:hypothetical protein